MTDFTTHIVIFGMKHNIEAGAFLFLSERVFSCKTPAHVIGVAMQTKPDIAAIALRLK